jgi:hypothetical protein
MTPLGLAQFGCFEGLFTAFVRFHTSRLHTSFAVIFAHFPTTLTLLLTLQLY